MSSKTPAPRDTPPVTFQQRSELLDFLLEVTTTSSETLDLQELLASVAEIVRRVIPWELFSILLFSEKRQDLRIRYAVGHREEIVRNLRIPLGEGIVGTAAQSRQPVLVDDVQTDERYLAASDIVRSELCVPMIARNRLIGVIDLQSARVGTFHEHDRTILRLIAGRVGAAIDNAQIYRRAERQYETLRTLSRISHEFSSILDIDELLKKIASSVRRLISYDAFSILILDPEGTSLRHRVSIRYDKRVDIDNIPLGKGITGAAATSGEIVRVVDTLSDARYIASHPGIHSEIAVPLIVRHKVIGVMDLESERIGHFTAEHARTLSLLAPSVAIAVENARLYEEIGDRERLMQNDLQAAFEVQTVLLPQEAPPVQGLEIAIGLRPARQISGDLYDFFDYSNPDGPNETVIAFGDSSGKGAAAALYGAMVSGRMRSMGRRRRSPSEMLTALNTALMDRKVEGKYVCLMLASWNPQTRIFTFANAGATHPVVCRDGKMQELRPDGVPLGLLPETQYEELEFQTQPGDLVVFYSDGVSDHQDPQGKEYGLIGLAGVLMGCHACPPSAVVDNIFADLDALNTVRFDDQTVMVFRVQ